MPEMPDVAMIWYSPECRLWFTKENLHMHNQWTPARPLLFRQGRGLEMRLAETEVSYNYTLLHLCSLLGKLGITGLQVMQSAQV